MHLKDARSECGKVVKKKERERGRNGGHHRVVVKKKKRSRGVKVHPLLSLLKGQEVVSSLVFFALRAKKAATSLAGEDRTEQSRTEHIVYCA